VQGCERYEAGLKKGYEDFVKGKTLFGRQFDTPDSLEVEGAVNLYFYACLVFFFEAGGRNSCDPQLMGVCYPG
jgi:hypothetical protein